MNATGGLVASRGLAEVCGAHARAWAAHVSRLGGAGWRGTAADAPRGGTRRSGGLEPRRRPRRRLRAPVNCDCDNKLSGEAETGFLAKGCTLGQVVFWVHAVVRLVGLVKGLLIGLLVGLLCCGRRCIVRATPRRRHVVVVGSGSALTA